MEEKNESLHSPEPGSNNFPTEMYHPTQNIVNFKKRVGGIPDIIVMIMNYFLTAELIASLFLSNSFNFTWKTTVVYFLFFITATIYIVTKKKELSLRAIPYGAAALILSCSFALHRNSGLGVVVLLAIIALSGIYCTTLTKSGVHSTGSYFSLIDILRCELTLPLKHLFTPYPAVLRGLSQREKKAVREKKDKKWLWTVLGVLLAIPVLCVVIPLLIDSDAAFGSLFSSVIEPLKEALDNFFTGLSDDLFSSEKIFAYIAALFIAPYIFSVMFNFRHGINRQENNDTSAKYIKLRRTPQSLAVAFLSVISVVYVIYLLSQTAYFFSAFTGKLPSGVKITVTEYARQGFFEMMKIAVINFILIALTVLFSKRKNGIITKPIKALDIFLCAFTVILSSTSLSKIILYINRFGLTQKRVYVFVFDIVLILAFLSVILRFFIQKFPYMKVIVASVCAALTLLSIVGADRYICDRNAELYLSGKLSKIDLSVMEEMSPASVKALVKIAQSDKEAATEARIHLLDIRREYAYYSYSALINRDGTINKKGRFDSIEEYGAVKALCDYFGTDSEESRYSSAYVYLFYPEEDIKSISVTTDKETLVVENADGTPLETKLYDFKMDIKDVHTFTFSVTTTKGESYSFESESNFAYIENEWDYDKDEYGDLKNSADKLDRILTLDEAWDYIVNLEITPE